MKKKILLLFTLATCFISMQAVESLKTVWMDELSLPRESTDAAGNDLIAISAANDVYVTGIFKGAFDFGTSSLESDFNSTYLAKYNADGTKAWAVGFVGAATPTAITVAEDGSVYVAGTLADEVALGSTDGNAQTIDGIDDGFGGYITDQATAFIAHYTAAGVLQKVQTYKPLMDEMAWLSSFGYDVFMNISKLQVNNGKLYAGLVSGGIYTNDNGIDVSGGSFFYADLGANMLTRSGYVLSLDNDLNFDAIITKLSLHADVAYLAHVFKTAFTIEGQNLYAAYTTMGKQVLTVGSHSEDIALTMTPEGDDVLYTKGYLVAKIDLSTKTLTSKAIFENKPLGSSQASIGISAVNSVDAAGESLIFTGIFQKELPFDNNIVAENDTNVFVSVLKAADLTLEAAKSSAYSGAEIWSSSAVLGDSVYVISNDTAAVKGNVYIMNLQNSSASLTGSSFDNTYLNAVASQGIYLAQVGAVLDGTDAKLRVVLSNTEKEENSVGEVVDRELTFYPNPVKNTLNLNKASDIQIYNLSGGIVAQAVNAKQINLASLTPGSYIAAARNSDGIQRLSFIKE